MEFLQFEWFFWLLHSVVFVYCVGLPLYRKRKILARRLATTQFSIGYLLFFTVVLAVFFQVAMDGKRWRSAFQENQELKGITAFPFYATFDGVSCEEQLRIKQERNLKLEQWLQENSKQCQFEDASLVLNETALEKLEDSWKRLEAEIQIEQRPGVVSLIPLPIKDIDTSWQSVHKRYQIQTRPDDRAELVFAVWEGKKLLKDYPWKEAEDSEMPFTVVKVNEENENMRFPLPPGLCTVDLKVHEKQNTKPTGVDDVERLEMIINGESLLLVEFKDRHRWFSNHFSVAEQIDYPRDNLHVAIKDVVFYGRKRRAMRMELLLSNQVSRPDVGATSKPGEGKPESMEATNE